MSTLIALNMKSRISFYLEKYGMLFYDIAFIYKHIALGYLKKKDVKSAYKWINKAVKQKPHDQGILQLKKEYIRLFL